MARGARAGLPPLLVYVRLPVGLVCVPRDAAGHERRAARADRVDRAPLGWRSVPGWR